MGILDRVSKLFSQDWNSVDRKNNKNKPDSASYEQGPSQSMGNHFALTRKVFDGEKNVGEIGPLTQYDLFYAGIRMRSWKAYMDSEIAQTVLNKFALWIVGSGLKLNSIPEKRALAMEGINLSDDSFEESAEYRFKVFSEMKSVHYYGLKNLNELAWDAVINSYIAGDCLVILRYTDKAGITLQLIDADNIQSPGSEYMFTTLQNGNKVRNGIEKDPDGQIVAYYVRKDFLSYERIPAKSGEFTTAFMVFGKKYKMGDDRGVPLITVVLEKIAKMDRYSEATLGSAEERSKIALQIVHDQNSTGENPFTDDIRKARDIDNTARGTFQRELPYDTENNPLANKIAATTNKQVFNMPNGSELKALESKNELYFKDFFTVNIDLICACIGIPPNVAMSKYDSNYSSSRAAIKEWEHTTKVERERFASQFYQRIYNFWLDIQILSGKIKAQGYLEARLQGNNFILTSYQLARWVGPKVPHIDPLKEVQAERLKLGDMGANIPLTTVESAIESLGGNDSDDTMMQFAIEKEYFSSISEEEDQEEEEGAEGAEDEEEEDVE